MRKTIAAAALLALALGLRVGYATHAWRSGLVLAHNDEYETIARNLVRHHRYDGILDVPLPTAAREPGFPFLIAAIYQAAGERPYAVLLAQCLLGVVTCGLMALLARRLFGEAAAWLTLVVCAVYPYFIYYSSYFYRETLLCFWLAAFLLALARLYDEPRSPGRAATAGALLGLCGFTFSTFMLLGPLMAVWALRELWRRRAGGKALASFALAAALLPGAWVARDYAVFHRLIPGSTMGGFNLYTALIVPEDVRGTEEEPKIEFADAKWTAIQAMEPQGLMADDGTQNEAFMQAAKEKILADPRFYLGHVGRQAAKLWRLYPYERHYVHSYSAIKWASLLSDGWLVPFGLWGLWAFRRRDPLVPFLAVVVGGGTFLYAVVSAIVRYRLPFMVGLIPLACGAAAEIARKRRAS